MINLLVITTLYPNRVQTRHGIFVETRLLKLLAADSGIAATVIAPVPWFPLKWRKFGRYAEYAKVPAVEERNGITIHHPRYLVLPKIGMLLTPFFLARSIKKCVARLKRQQLDYQLIDAHYVYPDGVAVARLASYLAAPLFVTARGSDINLIAELPRPRRKILKAIDSIDAAIAVSDALKVRMIELGIPAEKVHVLKNGVDTDFFRLQDQQAMRARWKLKAKTLLMVGNLVPEKRPLAMLEALSKIQDCDLLIAGNGPLKQSLVDASVKLGLQQRVTFLGNVDQTELVSLYNAVDGLVLPSAREGLPNVLLEAIACGCPVLAADVGGVKEIINSPNLGAIIKTDLSDFDEKLAEFLVARWDRHAIRAIAEQWSWHETINALKTLIYRFCPQQHHDSHNTATET